MVYCLCSLWSEFTSHSSHYLPNLSTVIISIYLFNVPVPHCCRRVNFARQILINRNVSGMFTYSMLLCYTNDLIYFSNSLSLSFFHSLKPIILQLHVKELNYVLDQNKKPKDDEDSVHSSPMLGATRKFFPLFLFNSALYASNLL